MDLRSSEFEFQMLHPGCLVALIEHRDTIKGLATVLTHELDEDQALLVSTLTITGFPLLFVTSGCAEVACDAEVACRTFRTNVFRAYGVCSARKLV